MGKVAYTLKLPLTSLIHPTFHGSQLRTAYDVPNKPTDLPTQLNNDLELMVQPEALLGVRMNTGSPTMEKEVLIQWLGLAESEATWEDFEKMQQQFPLFHLEDKVKVWEGGIDKPPVTQVHSRRNRKPKSSPTN